jgi:hypothetical protein
MPLRNADAQSEFELADAPGFSGSSQSIAKVWTGDFHGAIESQGKACAITCEVIALLKYSAHTGRT